MPKADNTTQEQLSEVVFSWQAPEDIKYHRGIWWYVISLVVLGLLVWWALATDNMMFAVFLGLFYVIVILFDRRALKMVQFAVTPDGVKFGHNFHHYREFNGFYIIYQEQGIKNLYLEFKNYFKGRMAIPLDDQDAVAVREFLLGYLEEDLDREGEPLTERLRRWLRL